MRCQSCNAILSDFEATRKSVDTGEYLDLCDICFSDISSLCHVLERDDLAQTLDIRAEDLDVSEET